MSLRSRFSFVARQKSIWNIVYVNFFEVVKLDNFSEDCLVTIGKINMLSGKTRCIFVALYDKFDKLN